MHWGGGGAGFARSGKPATIPLAVTRNTTIHDIKTRIMTHTGVPRDNIRLCFLGTVLGVTGDETNRDEEKAKVNLIGPIHQLHRLFHHRHTIC
jgi:hypothetical protein